MAKEDILAVKAEHEMLNNRKPDKVARLTTSAGSSTIEAHFINHTEEEVAFGKFEIQYKDYYKRTGEETA